MRYLHPFRGIVPAFLFLALLAQTVHGATVAGLQLSDTLQGKKARALSISDCFVESGEGVRLIHQGGLSKVQSMALDSLYSMMRSMWKSVSKKSGSPFSPLLILIGQEKWETLGFPLQDLMLFQESGECWAPMLTNKVWGSLDALLKAMDWKGLSAASNSELRKALNFDSFRAYHLIDRGVRESPEVLFNASLWRAGVSFAELLVDQSCQTEHMPPWVKRLWAIQLVCKSLTEVQGTEREFFSGAMELTRIFSFNRLKPFKIDFNALRDSQTWSQEDMISFEGRVLQVMRNKKVSENSILEGLEKLYDQRDGKGARRIGTRQFLEVFAAFGLKITDN